MRFGIGLAKKLAPGGEVDGYKFVSNYLGDFADFGLKCIDCAMCVTVCPQYRLIRVALCSEGYVRYGKRCNSILLP